MFYFLTSYLLAGKDAQADKFKIAEKNKANVINLRRLQKLLLGRLTIDALEQLEKLTKASFKGNAYEAAGAPPPQSIEVNTNPTDDAIETRGGAAISMAIEAG